MTMVHASLFSGIGGPEIAAEMMGWTNAFHCEINPFGRRVLEYWYPESESYEDITKTDFRPWRGKIDILTGGFPCQPFSYAGKRGGADDNRYLWPEMLRAIDEIRPAWVVGENVAGITTMVEGGVCTDLGGEATLWGEGDGVHRYLLRETFTIERICRDLESHGYSVQPVLIPAAAVGAPHRRDRIFIIASADDTDHDTAVRVPGGDACESREEWLRKRDEVQRAAIADNVRQEIAGAIAHAYGTGREESQQPGRGADRPQEGAGLHDRVERPCGDADATDTSLGLCDGRTAGIASGTEQPEPELGDGHFKDAADINLQRCNERIHPAQSRKEERFNNEADCEWGDTDRLLPEHRWDSFPTVSPVHRGNDGIPIRLDNLSIPFAKWRNESLKAYGNAIVVQVMYRIFQAIEAAQQP